jgi:glycosyltransferase involved in cell wall biosynthesis
MKVSFIERRDADTASIEGVFRQVATELEKKGIECEFRKLPHGNGFLGTVLNFLFFRRSKADIHHITGHCHYMAIALPADKTVLTVHDAGLLRNRRGLRRSLVKWWYFDLPVRSGCTITAISEATKKDLIEQTGIEPERVQVIANPVTIAPDRSEKPAFNTDRPRILQVGTAPHKNLDKIVEALEGISCVLVVIGRLSDEKLAVIAEAGLELEHHEALNESEMREQYRIADLVVFCSLFEGFGLPIIEAQAMRTPVVTSDIDPMASVAGIGAILTDPNDPASIRSAVLDLIENAGVRIAAVEAGVANIERFKGSKVADQYLAVYRKLLDSEKLKGNINSRYSNT